jgi:hypothetical protein
MFVVSMFPQPLPDANLKMPPRRDRKVEVRPYRKLNRNHAAAGEGIVPLFSNRNRRSQPSLYLPKPPKTLQDAV